MEKQPETDKPQQAILREQDGFLVVELPEGVILTGDPVAEAREERDSCIGNTLHIETGAVE